MVLESDTRSEIEGAIFPKRLGYDIRSQYMMMSKRERRGASKAGFDVYGNGEREREREGDEC